MNIKKIIVAFIFILSAHSIYSQNYFHFTRYEESQGLLNPAYAGTRNSLCGLLTYRNQWLDFEGAPVTYAFNIHMPIKEDRMGIGFTAMNEKTGMKTETDINLTYSYIIPVGLKSFLSFGLRGGIKNFNFDKTKALLTDPDDPFFSGNNETYLLPDFGFGVYFHTKKFYAGLSLPELFVHGLDASATDFDIQGFSIKQQHYFLYAGYVFKLNEKFILKPNFFGNFIYGAPVQFDIKTDLLYDNIFGVGLGYRTGESLNFLVDIKIYDQIRIGYSYDLILNSLNNYNRGTHEITALFNFKLKKDNSSMMNSPRNF